MRELSHGFMFHHDVLLLLCPSNLPNKIVQPTCHETINPGCCCGCLLSDAPGRTWHGLCCWGSTRYLQGCRMWRESYQTLELGELLSWMGKDCIYCCKFRRITSQVVEVIVLEARSSPARLTAAETGVLLAVVVWDHYLSLSLCNHVPTWYLIIIELIHSYQDGFTSGDLTHTHLASVQVPRWVQLGRWKVTGNSYHPSKTHGFDMHEIQWLLRNEVILKPAGSTITFQKVKSTPSNPISNPWN